jgi:hypothetical protein
LRRIQSLTPWTALRAWQPCPSATRRLLLALVAFMPPSALYPLKVIKASAA